MTFDELQLLPAVQKAVAEQGYTEPTPIQQQAIPIVLNGSDLLAGAQTGTGKTAAFTLPLLHLLAQGKRTHNRAGGVGIRALILSPTRELAGQINESIQTYGRYLPLKSAVVFGGVGIYPQANKLRRGVDILVATPGRLLDLQGQGFLDLSTVQSVVLDEADRMLDMGFIHDVRKILDLLPKKKQAMLFSATFNEEIRSLSSTLLNKPEYIQIAAKNTTVKQIKQSAYLVGRQSKKGFLTDLITQNQWWQVLVFTRTKFGADNLTDYLERNGVSAVALHGNKSQSARSAALNKFKMGKVQALVATDIAARGIDIENLPYVVNYEIPNICEDYVHRIGRTGRAGKEGSAISLVSMDEEGFLAAIERFIKQDIPRGVTPEEHQPLPNEQPKPIVLGRQVIWGGRSGKAPPKHVMQAAAKQARQEMASQRKPRAGGNSQQPRHKPGAGAATTTEGTAKRGGKHFEAKKQQRDNKHPFADRAPRTGAQQRHGARRPQASAVAHSNGPGARGTSHKAPSRKRP